MTVSTSMNAPSESVCRVLVADDERLVLEAYRVVLEGVEPPGPADAIAGLEQELFGAAPRGQPAPRFVPVLCRCGEDAVEAVRAAREQGYSFPLAFLDVRMPPGIDGVEAAARIRALDPDINIVIVTAHTDTQPRMIAQRVPPLEKLFYVTKPFQATEIQQFALALHAKWTAERQLRQANEALSTRCHQLETMQQEVREARDHAELASRAKSEFLANMSHELRTPLNAVIGFTDLMRSECFGPIGNERYRDYLDDISQSGLHLLRIINELLDFSKIEAGKLEVNLEPVDVGEVVRSAAAIMQQEAVRNGLTLQLLGNLTGISVQADPHRLRQILLNLLSNAIKFTPSPGRVEVAIETDETGGVSIRITDTGIGIANADIERALQPFGQIEQALSRRYPGTGLGLPLSIRLAELQGASLTLSSELKKGTTAVVRFPRGAVLSTRPDTAGPVTRAA
jgi:two-component system, cell cycle sensor histidine kinase PleC